MEDGVASRKTAQGTTNEGLSASQTPVQLLSVRFCFASKYYNIWPKRFIAILHASLNVENDHRLHHG